MSVPRIVNAVAPSAGAAHNTATVAATPSAAFVLRTCLRWGAFRLIRQCSCLVILNQRMTLTLLTGCKSTKRGPCPQCDGAPFFVVVTASAIRDTVWYQTLSGRAAVLSAVPASSSASTAATLSRWSVSRRRRQSVRRPWHGARHVRTPERLKGATVVVVRRRRLAADVSRARVSPRAAVPGRRRRRRRRRRSP